MRPIILSAAILLAVASTSTAEIRYVRAGDNLQAALNAAEAGDELRLAAGAVFTGNFVLPVFSGTTVVTVRTDLADAEVPGANQRVTPATASRFAKIVSPNTAPSLRTAPGAHHWRVMLIDFPSTKDGFGDIIAIGDGSSAQSQLSQVPYEITIDRVYVHGDALKGQKRGIALNGRLVAIRNSYISDIKAVGVDTQAIGGWNGPGPLSIENNYLEASGEGFLLGGSDPPIDNLVTEDVLIRYNHMTRPMSWRDPIVPAPSGVSASSASGGSLPGAVYAYRVVARRPAGAGSSATSLPSEEVTAVATGGAVKVSWTAVEGAADYRVYGRAPGAASLFWTVTGTSFTDTGEGGSSGKPSSTATRWQVKNIFELKNARRVRVEYNLFENNWEHAQQGYSILFTPRNQGGGCPWCVIEQVEFTHNIVRNVAAGISITGYDTNGPSGQTSGITIADNLIYGVTRDLGGSGWPVLIGDAARDIVFDHNTFDFEGTTLLYAYASPTSQKLRPRTMPGFRFTNNASPHGTYGINGADASPGTLTLQMYFSDGVVSGNWLSGGAAARYPPGNRFDSGFALQLTPTTAGGAQPAPGIGANLSKLLPLLEAVPRGLMSSPPERPRGLRIISKGK
jgi:hypothetical protein